MFERCGFNEHGTGYAASNKMFSPSGLNLYIEENVKVHPP